MSPTIPGFERLAERQARATGLPVPGLTIYVRLKIKKVFIIVPF